MARLRLETHEDQTRFAPGQVVHGLAGWELDAPPKAVELRLVWHTQGKGDRDVKVAHRQPLTTDAAVDAQLFELTLPTQPYSFSGRLIALAWALELVIDDRHSTRLELVIAPGAEELDLTAEPAEG